ADDHRLLAGATALQPVAEQLLGIARAVDEGRVEEVAAALPEGIEQDGAGGKAAEVLEAESDDRSRLVEPRKTALGNSLAAGGERAAGQRPCPSRGRLDLVLDAGIGTPLVEDAGVAEAVGPAHAARGDLPPAGGHRTGRGADL